MIEAILTIAIIPAKSAEPIDLNDDKIFDRTFLLNNTFRTASQQAFRQTAFSIHIFNT